MSLPIRVGFRENADYLLEGFKEFPLSTPRLLAAKSQKAFFGFLIGGAMAYALWQQYRKGAPIKILVFAAFFVGAILLFWCWFFKKIGYGRYEGPGEYQFRENDRSRAQAAYLKQTGVGELIVYAEFDEAGFRLNPEGREGKSHDWAAIARAVEVPAGVFIFIRKRVHFWFARRLFANKADYGEFLQLVERKVATFSRVQLEQMAFIAIGANLGDSRQNVEQALKRVRGFSNVRTWKSSLWQTTPVDCPPGSAPFVNAVVGLLPQKDETPESLLKKLQALEKEFGRRPKKVLNEARPLDLDLIAFGGASCNTQQLVLPHPRAHLRRFVLQPLSEIAPDLLLPGQSKTVAQLLAELSPSEIVQKLK